MEQSSSIFFSATSGDLKQYRWFAETRLMRRCPGSRARAMEDFLLGSPGIADLLRMEISQCDGIVCLIGDVYGAEPQVAPPSGRRSYTQMEYDIAVGLGMPVFCLMAGAKLSLPRVEEDETKRLLQMEHIARVKKAHRYARFDSAEELAFHIGAIDLGEISRFSAARRARAASTPPRPPMPGEGTGLVCIAGVPAGAAFSVAHRQYLATTADIAALAESALGRGEPVTVLWNCRDFPGKVEAARPDPAGGRFGWLKIHSGSRPAADLSATLQVPSEGISAWAAQPVKMNGDSSRVALDYVPVRLGADGAVCAGGPAGVELMGGTPLVDEACRVFAVLARSQEPRAFLPMVQFRQAFPTLLS